MATGPQIGSSLLFAFVLVSIFSSFWPELPKNGVFGGLSWQVKSAVVIISGLLVIGPGRVAKDLLTDSGW